VTPAPADPLGHAVLAERLARLPEFLRAQLALPVRVSAVRFRSLDSLIATGIGSSEPQARYFAWLLNRFARLSAEFLPLTAFADPEVPTTRAAGLAVFSQGLSANTRLAFDQRQRFGHTLLFTAAAGRPDRAQLLAALKRESADLVPFLFEDEYTILIRVVGPLTGLLAARQTAAQLAPEALPAVTEHDLEPVLAAAATGAGEVDWSHPGWAAGAQLVVPAPLSEFAHNLAYKFVEGVFWAAPAVTDYLGLAHGPLQQLAARPRPVLVFTVPAPDPQAELSRRALEVLRRAVSAPVIAIPLHSARPDLYVLEADAALSARLLPQVARLGLDQRHWPGQGLDGPLYQFPLTS
jgi:hypothetical protein